MGRQRDTTAILIDHSSFRLTCPVHGDEVDVKRVLYPSGPRVSHAVARDGRVFSIPKPHEHQQRRKKLRLMSSKSTGYVRIQVYDGTRHSDPVYAHRLVASAWLPAPQPGQCAINHKDHNRSNNHVDNLEWCSAGENVADWQKFNPAAEEQRRQSVAAATRLRHARKRIEYMTPRQIEGYAEESIENYT